jgi:hypothetical protein
MCAILSVCSIAQGHHAKSERYSAHPNSWMCLFDPNKQKKTLLFI